MSQQQTALPGSGPEIGRIERLRFLVGRQNFFFVFQLNNNKNERVIGNFKVEWGPKFYQFINNALDVTKTANGIYNMNYRLRTPKYLKEDTFATDVSYGYLSEFHKVK